jgi:protein TonB
MLDIIFQNREKNYGAYILRKQYPRHLFIALILSCWLFLMAIFMPNWLSDTVKAVIPIVNKGEITFVELPPAPPINKKEIVIPPAPKERPKIKITQNLIPEPTPPDELPDEEPKINDNETLEKASTLGTIEQEGEDIWDFDEAIITEGDGPPDVIKTEEDEDPGIGDVNFDVTLPKAINLTDIQKAIKFPEAAIISGTTGRVVVRILVDKHGKYKKHKVIKSSHPLLSAAVEEELKGLVFTPAIQGDRAVSCWVNIPFVFRLME